MIKDQDVCKGSIHLGTGCKRCHKCAAEFEAEIARLNDEISNAYDNVTVHEAPAGMVMMPEDAQQHIATLEATNAAQAEQLAQLERFVRTEQTKSRCLEQAVNEIDPEGPASVIRYGIKRRQELLYQDALLQSIPPEPQAGVELTDAQSLADELLGVAVEYENGKEFDEVSYNTVVRCINELRALNQRQAVKEEPGCAHEFHYFGDEVKQRRCVSCNKLEPEPLSANGTPPEGYVLVPIEPTDAMLKAVADYGWHEGASDCRGIYADMIAAAPASQDGEGKL